MSKVYLPTSEQMDTTLANLERISGALGNKVDLSSWSGIRRAVKLGLAPRLIPIGTQFTVPHSVYGDLVFDVVAHDHYKKRYDENAHTMTLMCHDQIGVIQFDSPEAFYYADATLPAGTYNFTIKSSQWAWTSGTYQFTLSRDLPVGGQLCISGDASVALTERRVVAYESRVEYPSVWEEVAIASGNAGTSLGDFGTYRLNHIHRVSYGSNNYKESAIRQFLNSSEKAGSVWTPQTKFDRPPTWATTLDGFIIGLDDDFLAVIGEVIVPCVANSSFESPDSTTVKGEMYTVIDKFYLASRGEIAGTGSNNYANDNSSQFAYYKDATRADRIKYKDGSAVSWLTRSWSLPHRVYGVGNTGGEVLTGVEYSSYFAPTCTIV